MMPDKTSCKCNYNICVKCFHKDFQERKRMYSITKRGETGDVEKCNDNSLEGVLTFCDTRVGDDTTFFAGRCCPFCNILQLWGIAECPHVRESTGRLTFFSAAYNWNTTGEEGEIINTIEASS